MSAQGATLGGRVYQDYNNNGRYDTSNVQSSAGAGTFQAAVDIGVANVTVTVLDAAGNAVSGTSTAPDGLWSITPTFPGPYRIEFTNLPPGFQSGAFGEDSGTTVQFADAAGRADIDLGIIVPSEYCQDNPDIAGPCYVFGNQVGDPAATNSEESVFITFPYGAGSNAPSPGGGTNIPASYDVPTTHSVNIAANRMGTTWGVAWSRTAQRLYASAYFKRHSGFGPGEDGNAPNVDDAAAIYVIDPATNAVVDVFTVPGINVNAHDSTNFFRDNNNTGWDAVGKTSLGGMAMSEDETRLYVMNLENRVLYALDIATGAPVAQSLPFTSAAGCPASDVRPFAVSVYRGALYVGAVCSAESTPGDRTQLQAFVFSVNPNTLANNGIVFQFRLDYPRSIANFNGAVSANWNPWSSTFQRLATPAGDPGAYYPQPMFTDIAFDNGDMIIGLRDRAGDQIGSFTPSDPSQPDTFLLAGVGVGDTLRACTVPTGWALESGGLCGTTGTGGIGVGPGGAEYYFDDGYGIPGEFINHDEMGLGGVSQIPGFPDVVVTTTNPYPFDTPFSVYDGGIRWLNNDTGGWSRAYRLFDDQANPGVTGKANGLGDLAAMCFAAPIEVGNRVWEDVDRDGIQDADERPLGGVEVQLIAPDGRVLATVVTNPQGEYYFSSDRTRTDTPFADYGLSDLRFNTTGYEIRIRADQPIFTSNGLTITNTDGSTRLRGTTSNDNNGINGPGNTYWVTRFNTAGPGVNDHTLDFGFVLATTPTATPQPGVATATVLPGTSAPTTPGVPGVVGTVPPGVSAADAGVAGQTTVSAGLSKGTSQPFVFPGQTVTFTLVASNPTASPYAGVTLSDNMPNAFEVISATSTGGSVAVNGQAVTLQLPNLNPGESVTVTITARVRQDAGGGAVTNTARLSNSFAASATVVIVSSLPALGDEPWWRIPLLLALAGGAVWGVLRLRRRNPIETTPTA